MANILQFLLFALPTTSTIKPHPRAKPEWVRRQALYLATHQGSCRSIAYTFNRWYGCGHGNETIGKSWVAEFIKQHAVEIAEEIHSQAKSQGQWVYALDGLMVGYDLRG